MTETVDVRWGSWNRRLTRRVLRPFVATRLRPNHITTLRIVTGIAACTGFADGSTTAAEWGGVFWVISAFLDRCDGEFARMTGATSRFGKNYDFAGDVIINATVFLAIGIGFRKLWLDGWAIPLGCVAAAGVAIASLGAEWNERGMGPGKKTFNGAFGFDFDDLIYLIAPFAWVDVLELILIGGAVGGPLAAAVIVGKLLRNARCPDRPHR